MWSDWVQIGTPASMGALAAMTDAPGRLVYTTDESVRCFGLCHEEQTALQLQARGVRLLRLSLPLALRKPSHGPCGSEPLLNASELAQQHQISDWYAPCPPCGHRHG